MGSAKEKAPTCGRCLFENQPLGRLFLVCGASGIAGLGGGASFCSSSAVRACGFRSRCCLAIGACIGSGGRGASAHCGFGGAATVVGRCSRAAGFRYWSACAGFVSGRGRNRFRRGSGLRISLCREHHATDHQTSENEHFGDCFHIDFLSL
jgi:hypothetical protein